MPTDAEIDAFTKHRAPPAAPSSRTQSFINGLCALIGVVAPYGRHADNARHDYVVERRLF